MWLLARRNVWALNVVHGLAHTSVGFIACTEKVISVLGMPFYSKRDATTVVVSKALSAKHEFPRILNIEGYHLNCYSLLFISLNCKCAKV